MIRALDEFEIEGVATTIPAHLAILRHPDWAAARHSTRWVEESLDLSGVAAPAPTAAEEPAEDGRVQRDVDVEVDGRRYRVRLWVPDLPSTVVAGAGALPRRPRPAAAAHASGGAAGSGNVTAPLQGPIVQVCVAVG